MMLAPVIFRTTAMKQIAIDAYDICRVREIQDEVEITYIVVHDKPDTFTTLADFEDVLNNIRKAQNDVMPKRPRDDGEAWKGE